MVTVISEGGKAYTQPPPPPSNSKFTDVSQQIKVTQTCRISLLKQLDSQTWDQNPVLSLT